MFAFAFGTRLRSEHHWALTVSSRSLESWPGKAALSLTLNRDRIAELYQGTTTGTWQTAHVIPPLVRFLNTLQDCLGKPLEWDVSGIRDPFEPITTPVSLVANGSWPEILSGVSRALRRERLFRRDSPTNCENIRIKHQMGWTFEIQSTPNRNTFHTISDLVRLFDPLANGFSQGLAADLHMHTAWSDGSASVDTMARAVV